jgi:hypothetical protein
MSVGSRPAAGVPRFLVVQYGARHGYAIPAAFARAGALAGLYTDFTTRHGVGRLLAAAAGLTGAGAKVLARRTPPPEVAGHTHAFGAAFLLGEAGRRLARGPLGVELATRRAKGLAEGRMVACGTQGATHLYTMLGEGGRLVEQAGAAGLGIVADVYIALSADAIVRAEAARHPDWSDGTSAALPVPHNRIMLAAADLFVCPSEFVRDDLVGRHGVAAARTVVVPYAVSPRWLSLEPRPEPGRILFAGTAELRKGIHVLAEAARLLGPAAAVRVAGRVANVVRRHPAAQALTFLGHLPLCDMAAEFARADVFCLPSLAEGSASVTAEALGAGVPVVTTRAAGSIVRDGVDGFIVPERDGEALAAALATIVADRALRARMSRAARERATAFSWDSFAQAVIAAV